jgi:hypothetical protein
MKYAGLPQGVANSFTNTRENKNTAALQWAFSPITVNFERARVKALLGERQ